MKDIDPRTAFKVGEWNIQTDLPPAMKSLRWKISADGKTAEVEEVWNTNHSDCPFTVLRK